MSKVEDFLTSEEEQEIVAAICMAEQNTSGEIRVHIEKTTSLDAYDRALEVFQQLKMDQTELKNGVLIYVAVKDRNFVICGDEGINNVVKDDFWNSTRDAIVSHFKNGDFKQGLIAGIVNAGEQLQHYFPHLDGDVNELSNEISKG
ncbi:TPM domain-containing protein [Flavobacterium weaverense]|uniref:TLP18.3/Psb32/MOLO-1 phosphatase superfamily protein n=1 Tax=Flavobacterium weaverense TaxID=271156 RepID=A0A3M0A0C2_9FLAO|nr:TPM domain-containing protein [Flavobacterium weaverense]RMA78017.1 TLP18.3/Psb32/MOLO-1 phosphatase superfamily protein [Flavobacterium weaverense]